MQIFKTEEELRHIRLMAGLAEYMQLFLCASIVVGVIVAVYIAI